jgi:hypothetical protein
MPAPAKSLDGGTLAPLALLIGALPNCLPDSAEAELLLPTRTLLESRLTSPPPLDPPDRTPVGSGEGAEELAGKKEEMKLETCERYGAVDTYTPPNHEAPPSSAVAGAPPAPGGEAKATYAVNAAKAAAKPSSVSLARRHERPLSGLRGPASVHGRPLCFHRPFMPPGRRAGLRFPRSEIRGERKAAAAFGRATVAAEVGEMASGLLWGRGAEDGGGGGMCRGGGGYGNFRGGQAKN